VGATSKKCRQEDLIKSAQPPADQQATARVEKMPTRHAAHNKFPHAGKYYLHH